ncbi:MAG: ArsC family transcriptional regulator, partial [Leptospiraceae bacterium]|nr:ArsC family transcriptional regulator [Leptospiraceae bacterium]
KAEMFFKERRVAYHFVNIEEKPMSKGELESVMRWIPAEELIDPESKEYKKLQLQYMKYNPLQKLLEHPLLLRTPVVRSSVGAVSGYEPQKWKELI